jgi:hypothetical protein
MTQCGAQRERLTAKLSPAVSGGIVQVLLADSGIKWWLVFLNGRSNTAGWILRAGSI